MRKIVILLVCFICLVQVVKSADTVKIARYQGKTVRYHGKTVVRFITTPAKPAYYIDPTQGTNGSGTFASPFNTFPYELVSNSDYLLKAGTTLTGNFYLTGDYIKLGRYGTGANPKISYSDKGTKVLVLAGNHCIVDGVDVTQGNDDDSNECFLFYGDFNTVKNCTITGGSPGIEAYNGVKGNGGTFTIYNVNFTNTVSDGLYVNQLDYVYVKKVNVSSMTATPLTATSVDGIHIIYPLYVNIDSSYVDHTGASGKYGLICTAQNIEGQSNGGMIVKNTTLISGTNEGCAFPALDTATFVNCTFQGGQRFIQTPADILNITNCTFTGTTDLTWGVESSLNQTFYNCLFSSIPSGITAILNGDAVLTKVTINGVDHNGSYTP